MMDPDYPVGIADGILTQIDYLMRLAERSPDMRPDLLQRLHDGVNEYKAAITVDFYESVRLRALRRPLVRIGGDGVHVPRVRALLPVHRPGVDHRPVLVPVRGRGGVAPPATPPSGFFKNGREVLLIRVVRLCGPRRMGPQLVMTSVHETVRIPPCRGPGAPVSFLFLQNVKPRFELTEFDVLVGYDQHREKP